MFTRFWSRFYVGNDNLKPMFYDENALCVINLYICTGSFGHKYFILNRNVLGSIYIGNQDELIGSDVAITGNSVQTPSSPLLRPLKQDQFSFDMELCDIVTITKGSFIVAEMSTPQNGKYIYLLVLYNLKTEISHILKFQMIWETIFCNIITIFTLEE